MTADVPITDAEFTSLRELVYAQTGIFLRETKRSLLKSRLMKRLRYYEYEDFAQYYDHLKHRDPAGCELQAMINAVTTNKTSFFREQHHFALLAERILAPARRLALQAQRQPLRIWSAGCSSGEEPYSIAITVAANLDRLAAWDIKILASDIDTEMLEKARAGIYSRDAVSALPEDFLKGHFLRGKDEYAGSVRVKPFLRNLVTFARINLMEPWRFRQAFDAIFCRNVIIYFDRDSQRRVLERFAQCLKPGGLFLAGHSENLFWLDDLFEPIGQTAYRPRRAANSNTDPL